MSMIKLVAFDWNGTILSDTNLVVRAESALMDTLGMPKHSLKRARAHFTIPIKDYWIALGSTEEFFNQHEKEISELFMKNYSLGENSVRTRAGVKLIINWLHENQISKVIFSNHTKPRIENQLLRLGLTEHFERVLAREEGDLSYMRQRGKGQKLNDYVTERGFEPSQVVTVGDTIEEIEIGKTFGYNTVGITGGNQSTIRLKNAKPDFLIHKLTELKSVIENL